MSKAHKPAAQAPVRHARNLAVAPFEGFDRNATIAVPQGLIDDQLASLTEGELKLMLCVIRATNGGQREGIALSVRALCSGGLTEILPGRGSGLSARTVQAACAKLATAGYLRVQRRTAPDGSGLPSLFTLPLFAPGMNGAAEPVSPRFPGYSASRRVRLPLLVIDRLLAELSGAELRVLLYVLRRTFCVGVQDEVMPMAHLVENTGLSLRHTRLAVAGLATRGIMLVQHRQNAERGKLPSSFGVPVLGEVPPFASVAPAPGLPARAARSEEPVAEQARPVWLVPNEPEASPAIEKPEREVTEAAVPAPILQVFPAAPPPAGGAPVPTQTPVAGTQSTGAARGMPPGRRQIPEDMTLDVHPVWAAVKRILAAKLPYHIFTERVATTTSVGPSGSELLIAVQNEHHRWWMESKLCSQVRDALAEAGYPNQRVRYLNYDGTIPISGEGQ